MSRTLLEVKNLKTYFPIRSGLLQRTTGFVKAVDDVSFSLNEGETFGLVGESGSGKSTTAFTIMGIYPPTSGEIRFQNQKLTGGGVPEPIPGRIPDYINPPTGCRFSPRCPHAKPICTQEVPDFRSLGEGREVACFLYD